MKKFFITKIAVLILLATSIFSSCMEKDVYQGPKSNKPLNPSEVFDFKLTNEVKLNIDYGFTNDYYIIFEIYDQNPMKEEGDSWVKDESLSSIYSASTDTKGQYSGTITLASDITEVWLYSDYLGTINPIKLSVDNGEINYDQAAYIASLNIKTRGTTAGNHSYPNDWITMPGVDWDNYGLPSNVEPERYVLSADILYRIRETYNNDKKQYIDTKYPDWIKGNATSEIKITKATELSIVFAGINSASTWCNAVGYYTYPTGSTPTEANIQKVLIFPNSSPLFSNNGERKGTLLPGHKMNLKYWSSSTQQFEDKFPAGVTIGLCMEGNGFVNGDIKKINYSGFTTRYSFSTLNPSNKQHTVALRDGSTDQVVTIGFEDNKDFNYCDALFCMEAAEPGAIGTNLPVLPSATPPSNLENTTTYKGTLTFEDQWPEVKDYDMNDVVIEYKSTLYRQVINNKVYKIVDEFTPIHNGGSHICGFGYQLHKLQPDRVTSIKVEGPEGWKVESEQAHPTVTLFDNVKSVMKQTFTVTTELSDVDLKDVTPPYNPFIFVNDRSVEVHLVNYPPTNKANMELFNTKDDASNTSVGVYYIARFDGEVPLMPFGINLSNVLGFNIPAENVKIYDTYPGFIDWVKSNGTKNKDWYKK